MKTARSFWEILFLVYFSLTLLLSAREVLANEPGQKTLLKPFYIEEGQIYLSVLQDDLKTPQTEIEAKKLDQKAEILARYLAKFNSPMQYHAQDFIDASSAFGLDWKLLPAIAGVESTFGKRIPGGFNAWGWGVYGTQAIYFNSWRDGMFTVAKGLRENYLNKGLTDPYSINKIYAASPSWGSKVSFFMQDMEKFASEYSSNQLENAKISIPLNIAADSGQLVSR